MIYAGPKIKNELTSFNDPARNPYQMSDLNLDAAVDSVDSRRIAGVGRSGPDQAVG